MNLVKVSFGSDTSIFASIISSLFSYSMFFFSSLNSLSSAFDCFIMRGRMRNRGVGNVTIKGRARKSRARNVSSYYVNRTLSLCIMIATEGSSGAY